MQQIIPYSVNCILSSKTGGSLQRPINIHWPPFSFLIEVFSWCTCLFHQNQVLVLIGGIQSWGFHSTCQWLVRGNHMTEFWPMTCEGRQTTAFWDNISHTEEQDTARGDYHVCFCMLLFLDMMTGIIAISCSEPVVEASPGQRSEGKSKQHACSPAVLLLLI